MGERETWGARALGRFPIGRADRCRYRPQRRGAKTWRVANLRGFYFLNSAESLTDNCTFDSQRQTLTAAGYPALRTRNRSTFSASVAKHFSECCCRLVSYTTVLLHIPVCISYRYVARSDVYIFTILTSPDKRALRPTRIQRKLMSKRRSARETARALIYVTEASQRNHNRNPSLNPNPNLNPNAKPNPDPNPAPSTTPAALSQTAHAPRNRPKSTVFSFMLCTAYAPIPSSPLSLL